MKMTENEKLGRKSQYFEEQFWVEKWENVLRKIVKIVKIGRKWYFEIKSYFGENVQKCKFSRNWNSDNWNALEIESCV